MMTRYEPDVRAGVRRAFTLVELLVVISIIALLATLTLGVMHSARETARTARTEALIAKIDQVIQDRYQSYQTRRVSIDTRGRSAQTGANRRLSGIRDIMRMEMPQCWNEVRKSPITFTPGSGPWSVPAPALYRAYRRRVMGSSPPSDKYESAECLYLIVTLGSPDARDTFNDREIGDVDNDGYFEFIDGWGNPIKFLRTAPGICDSDVQYVVATPTGGIDRNLMVDAVKNDYDPFDFMQVDKETTVNPVLTDRPPRSWRLLPLVYSAGPDGLYDIRDWQTFLDDNAGAQYSGNPYYYTNAADEYLDNDLGLAEPIPSDSVTNPEDPSGFSRTPLGHYDNIHNHRVKGN